MRYKIFVFLIMAVLFHSCSDDSIYPIEIRVQNISDLDLPVVQVSTSDIPTIFNEVTSNSMTEYMIADGSALGVSIRAELNDTIYTVSDNKKLSGGRYTVLIDIMQQESMMLIRVGKD